MLIQTTKTDCDILAQRLMQLGQMARSMPPAWQGAEIAHPVLSPNGGTLGRILPGKGLSLTEDLKSLGIRRTLPAVYEYSKFRWLLDTLGNQRGAITTYDQMLTARLTHLADDVVIYKGTAFDSTPLWYSAFRDTGTPVGAGSYTNIPGGAAHDMTSAGAWSSLLHKPSGTDKKYLVSLGWQAAVPLGCFLLVDLLVAAGNILCTTTSPQTINTTALTRYTTGAGVLLTFAITTTLSNTSETMAVNKYSNQAGTANQSTAAVLAVLSFNAPPRLVPVGLGPCMALADGDYGVRSVEEITMGTALGAGILALNLYYPLAFLPGLDSGTYVERDFVSQVDGLVELVQVSGMLGCLTAYYLTTSAATATGLLAHLRTVEG